LKPINKPQKNLIAGKVYIIKGLGRQKVPSLKVGKNFTFVFWLVQNRENVFWRKLIKKWTSMDGDRGKRRAK
jgi:hypothetical protein